MGSDNFTMAIEAQRDLHYLYTAYDRYFGTEKFCYYEGVPLLYVLRMLGPKYSSLYGGVFYCVLKVVKRCNIHSHSKTGLYNTSYAYTVDNFLIHF